LQPVLVWRNSCVGFALWLLLLLLLPGHMHGINTAAHPGQPHDLAIAEAIAGGCYEMYRQSPSGEQAFQL
jgi:hypothetical protein